MAQTIEFSSIQPSNQTGSTTRSGQNSDPQQQERSHWQRYHNYQVHPQQQQQQHVSMLLQQQQQQQAARLQAQQQSPTVVYQVAPHASVGQSYKYRQAYWLSLAQVAVGLCCIIFQLASFGVEAYLSQTLPGVWAGIMFMVTGVTGCRSAITRTQCWVVAFLVLSVLNAVLCAPVMFLTGVGIASDSQLTKHVPRHDCGRNCSFLHMGDKRDAKLALNSLLILLALLQCILACWAAAICCAGVCCRAPPIAGEVVFYNPGAVQAFPGSQQVVVVSPGQSGLMYGSPMSLGSTAVGPQPTRPFHIDANGHSNPMEQISSQRRSFHVGESGNPSAPPFYNNRFHASHANSFNYQPLEAQGGGSRRSTRPTMAQEI